MVEIEEVVSNPTLRRLSGFAPWVAGVTLRDNRVLGVIDPAVLLGELTEDAGGAGAEILVMRGEPGLALIARSSDAVAQPFVCEDGPSEEGLSLLCAGRVLRCSHGGVPVVDVSRLRISLRAMPGQPGARFGGTSSSRTGGNGA
jgi:hypothetical protein